MYETQLLDLYLPVGGPRPRPGLVVIHGGGFTHGSREGGVLSDMAMTFASRGVVAISIDYRLAGDDPPADPAFEVEGSPYDAAIHAALVDTRRAVRWLRANASRYSIDTARIAALGGSAGAVLSLTSAVAEPDAFLTDLPGQLPEPWHHPDQSNALQAAVSFWGAAIIDYASPDDPPVCLIHGTEDRVVPFRYATELAAAYNDLGLDFELYPLEGEGHGPWEATIDGLPLVEVAYRFLARRGLVPHAGAGIALE